MKDMKVKSTVDSEKSSFFQNSANYTCKCLGLSCLLSIFMLLLGFFAGTAFFGTSPMKINEKIITFNSNHEINDFNINIIAMQNKANSLKTYLENYYKSEKSSLKKMLNSGLGLNYNSNEYNTSIKYLSKNFKLKLSRSDSEINFIVGVIGSSVAAAHDNCNYDGYERQMERLMKPVFDSGGTSKSSIFFKVLNAGEGGGCGDTHENQVFCVRQAVGEDVDVVHYSWSYFEGRDHAVKQHEQIIRWSLMLENNPAVQLFNTGGKLNICLNDEKSKQLFNKYSKFGFNALCLEAALYGNGGYKGKEWEAIGDGLHDIVRYGNYRSKSECESEEFEFQGCDFEQSRLTTNRKESLGVTWRNWHPGPLGFQTVADLFVYQYLEALILAIDELILTGPVQPDLEPLMVNDLGDPLFCSKEECNLEEPPGCLNLEKPTYGYHQIKIVDADDDLSPYMTANPKPLPVTEGGRSNGPGWRTVTYNQKILIPKAERRFSECQHFDNCAGVEGSLVADSWLVFQLPKMTIGRVILCGCCGKKVGEEMFINNEALEIQFDSKPLDRSKFKVYPNPKCVQVMEKFTGSVDDPTGHLYLALRFLTDSPQKVKITHVIAF